MVSSVVVGKVYEHHIYKTLYVGLRQILAGNVITCERVFYLQSYLMVKKEKTLKSSQDSNLGPLNSSQMLLPTEPLELWHWSRG